MRVLLAEDDEFMRMLIEAVLRAAGHDPVPTSNGEEAWSAYEREQPAMAILDWQMPRLDGLEVCRRIRGKDPRRETFIIVVTGRDASEDLFQALDAGADDYVVKPVTPEHLQARLAIAARRMEQDALRRAMERQLADAQRLAGIGETTLALQHEINNPLAALLGNAALINAGLVDGADKEKCLKVIAEQAQRIAAVVKKLSMLRNPDTVEYLQGARMIDLSVTKPGEAPPPAAPGDRAPEEERR
jgi:DNA-binding response OmpR family regulator